MRLYSLNIQNFKSFGPKETVIDFRPGLSMVAGPNGSGKSNIGDALLFVLGTRSSKSVRAEKLDDLIHNPGKDEKRIPHSSVKATFVEDRDEDSYERIEIERCLDQSGNDITSTYYINGKRSKHVDVDRFLENIGIQLDSYSFVLQGDINRFIYVTGTERRKLLESIAGIDSYNSRINAAKEKSDETEKVILASNTLKEELDSEVEKTKLETEKLKEFNLLNSDIRNLKATALTLQIRNMEIDKSGYENSLSSETTRMNSIASQIDELKISIFKLNERRTEIEKNSSQKIQSKLAEIREKSESLKLERARKDIEASNYNRKVQEIRENIESNEDKIGSIEKEIMNLGERYNFLVEEGKNLESKDKFLREQIRQRIELQRNKNDKYKKTTDELQVLEKNLKETYKELEMARKFESENVTGCEKIQSKLGIREEDLTSEKYKLSEAQWKLKNIQKNQSSNKNITDGLNRKYYQLQSEISENEKSRVDLRQKIDAVAKEVEKIRSEMGSQGFSNKPISALMEAKAKGAIKGIHRVMGEIISYEDKVSLAVETAAGARLNSLVVEDENVAQECIDYLREKRLGRVTLLPINKMVPGRPRGKALVILQSESESSLLSKNVTYDPIYENVVWYTFSDTILVNNMDTAKRYMTGVRIVTMDGDIFEASGAISGGFINRGRRTYNTADLQKQEKLLDDLRETLNQVESDIKERRTEFDSVSRQLVEISKSGGEGKGQESSLQQTIDSSQKTVENMSIEVQTLKNDLKIALSQLDEKREKIRSLESAREEMELKKKRLYSQIGDNPEETNDLNEMQRELEVIKISSQDNIKELSEKRTTIQKISERKIELIKQNDSGKIEITQLGNKTSAIEEEITLLSRDLKKISEEEEVLNKNNRETLRELKEVENEISRITQSLNSLDNEKRTLEKSTRTSRIKIQNLQERIDSVRRELEQTQGIPLPDFSSIQRVNAEIEIRTVKLQNIGAVNQLAEENLRELLQRRESLVEKLEKLQDEVNSLKRLMEELEGIKKNVLLEIYSKIRIEMKDIFKNLTKGGDVDMFLSDESNPLEAELLIKARPKGNSFTKLQSLSGGEKSLVALSFITAVQRSKPSPIYFLDEIDMFFDGANAESMGELLRENSNTSQIIMISLKNAMGKYANSLFGVTMNKKTNCTEIFSKSLGVV